jgi:DnaD/phage-associated family protein
MSVEVMSLVFKHKFSECSVIGADRSVSASAQKLVMLALADHANLNGESAYPSWATLQQKTNLSNGTLGYVLKALKQTGYITKGAKSKYQTVVYSLEIAKLRTDAPPPPVAKGTSASGDVQPPPPVATSASGDVPLPPVAKGTSASGDKPSIHPSTTLPEEETIDPMFSRVVQCYENNITLVVPMMADELKTALKEYPVEWIELAIKESAKAGVRSWNYAAAILRRWKKDGFQSDNRKSGGGRKPAGSDDGRYHPQILN